MRKLLFAFFLLFSITHLSSAQTETVIKQAVNYSESKSYQPRQFPVKTEKADSKKNKKSKKKEQEAANMQSAQSAAAPMPVIKDSTNASSQKLIDKTITVPVSVFNSSGYFVTNLAKSDFQIFADGQEQQILEVTTRNEPISLILLVDTSPSTAFRIEEIQKFAQAIVDKLQPDDKVMVIAFNEQTNVLSELTADRRTTAKAIGKLEFGDGTSLYEAVENTFDKYVSQISGVKTVVLLTDGVDTTSRRSDYKKSLERVEQSDAAVFPIYFNTIGNSIQSNKSNRMSSVIISGILGSQIGSGVGGSTEAEYERGRMYLTDLSVLSGGRPQQVKDIKDVKPENIDNISLELRARYQISFRPDGFVAGQRKQIVVRVKRPGLFIQARGSLLP